VMAQRWRIVDVMAQRWRIVDVMAQRWRTGRYDGSKTGLHILAQVHFP